MLLAVNVRSRVAGVASDGALGDFPFGWFRDEKENVPTVPLQALNHEGNKTTVFVVTPNGELDDRKVKVGLQTTSDAEILSGLNDGEQVVISDLSGLKAGEKVHTQTMAVMQYHEQNAQ